MLQGTLVKPSSLKRPQRLRLSPKALITGLCVALTLVTAGLWYASPPQVRDLGSERQMSRSGAYTAWAKGSVIVLVRHAERCDRSHAACLGDPAGITVDGSRAAVGVGLGLERLGLQGSDILASPEVRTRQTAGFMFGKEIATQDWLAGCDARFASAVVDHKRPGHNLVLVTHSGCIDQLERQLGVPGGERTSGYASALLLSIDSAGKPQILGQLNATQWRNLAPGTGA